MTPREPDRFDAQARELVAQHYGPALSRESVPWIAAALRAEHASALERAAQEYGSDDLADVKVYCRHVAQRLRALIPPAAAPAAETGTVWDPARNEKSWRPDAASAADYDPITAPIPEGDMNGPHGPMPAAETGKIEININDSVWVKVTPVGEQVYRQHWIALHMEPLPLRRDADGWTKFQLWELANVFGAAMYNGGRVPVETTIRIAAPPEREGT